MKNALTALRMTVLTLILTGLLYPFLVTALAQLLFTDEANGSLLKGAHGDWVGSVLIGQPFQRPAYFHPRPSAAGNGYDALASSGSNLGPTSARLQERAAQELQRLRQENPAAAAAVPVDLVTASASGLDPHLSPEAARWQIPRIAQARGVAADRIEALVASHTEERDLAILGEPRVNVLVLNLALDQQFGRPVASPPE
jgi:K+-transporting ATPase ATPase C chain